jgi:hypothetical protein
VPAWVRFFRTGRDSVVSNLDKTIYELAALPTDEMAAWVRLLCAWRNTVVSDFDEAI